MSDMPKVIAVDWTRRGDPKVSYMEDRLWPPSGIDEYTRTDTIAAALIEAERRGMMRAENALLIMEAKGRQNMNLLKGSDKEFDQGVVMGALATIEHCIAALRQATGELK